MLLWAVPILVVAFYFLIPMAALLLMLIAPSRIWQLRRPEEPAWQVIRRAIAITLVIPLMGMALYTPLRALAVVIHDWRFSAYPGTPLTFIIPHQAAWGKVLLRWIDSGIGALGAGFAVVGFLGFYTSNLRLRRQVESLATSTTRSAAIGLVELQGIARPAEGDDLKSQEDETRDEGGHITQWRHNPSDAILFSAFQAHWRVNRWKTFYLEDETGRILIDPRGVEFEIQGGFDIGTLNIRTIMLAKNQKVFPEGQFIYSLCPGDRIYIVGSAEIREDASPMAVDSERLVIRPTRTEKSQDLWRWFVGHRFYLGLRTAFPDVFLLSDSDEVDTILLLQRSIKPTLLLALVWIISGVWLFVRAAHW